MPPSRASCGEEHPFLRRLDACPLRLDIARRHVVGVWSCSEDELVRSLGAVMGGEPHVVHALCAVSLRGPTIFIPPLPDDQLDLDKPTWSLSQCLRLIDHTVDNLHAFVTPVSDNRAPELGSIFWNHNGVLLHVMLFWRGSTPMPRLPGQYTQRHNQPLCPLNRFFWTTMPPRFIPVHRAVDRASNREPFWEFTSTVHDVLRAKAGQRALFAFCGDRSECWPGDSLDARTPGVTFSGDIRDAGILPADAQYDSILATPPRRIIRTIRQGLRPFTLEDRDAVMDMLHRHTVNGGMLVWVDRNQSATRPGWANPTSFACAYRGIHPFFIHVYFSVPI